ncbi:hypothetical protein B0H16DRAFT_1481652 [Mycena metata]|uniref:Uncharacterized protein n=1 Tax=Mycena metata TaxID=1033252 RepID=A0AAD7GX16_9AGAR|nr:hypothetical protein B0H16DRAFT_1481652 [Mycena metata]
MFRALQILWDISRNFERRRIPWNSCLNPWVKYRRDLRRSMFEEQPKWRQIERKRGQMSRTDLWNFVTASVCVVYQAVGGRDRGQTNGHWLLMGSLRRRLKWVAKCVQVKRVRAREGSIQAWEILQSLPDEGKICTGVEAEFFAACKSTLGKLSATNPDGREFMGHSLLSLEGDIFVLAREVKTENAGAEKEQLHGHVTPSILSPHHHLATSYIAHGPTMPQRRRGPLGEGQGSESEKKSGGIGCLLCTAIQQLSRAALRANKAAIKADRERKSPKQNAQSAVMRESNDGAPEAADELPPPKLSRLLRYVPPQQAQSAVMRKSNDNVPDSADKLPPPDLPLLRYVDLYSDVDSADALPTFQPTPTILEDMNATLTNGRTRSTGLGVARGSGCPSLSVVSSPESAERMAARAVSGFGANDTTYCCRSGAMGLASGGVWVGEAEASRYSAVVTNSGLGEGRATLDEGREGVAAIGRTYLIYLVHLVAVCGRLN